MKVRLPVYVANGRMPSWSEMPYAQFNPSCKPNITCHILYYQNVSNTLRVTTAKHHQDDRSQSQWEQYHNPSANGKGVQAVLQFRLRTVCMSMACHPSVLPDLFLCPWYCPWYYYRYYYRYCHWVVSGRPPRRLGHAHSFKDLPSWARIPTHC